MKYPVYLSFFAASFVAAAPQTISSPDGRIDVSFDLVEGKPMWSISHDDKAITKLSPIEIYLGGKREQLLTFNDFSISRSQTDESWEPVWGQTSLIVNRSTDAAISLSDDKNPATTLSLRVFDNGVAVRYALETAGKKVSDNVHFSFAEDLTFWAANKELPNIGPHKISEWDTGKGLQAPLTFKSESGGHYAILEGAIYHQYPFHVRTVGGSQMRTNNRPAQWTEEQTASSWRVLSIGESAGDLVTSNILPNLNPPNEIEDTSWIKTGFTLWDWRSWGATAPDGFVYDLDMKSWRRFVDFAASHENVKYLMIDANWYGPEFDPEMDPKRSRDHLLFQQEDGHIVRKPAPADWEEPIDMPGLIKYANDRNVGIILYINDKAREKYDFEETLATYQKWGAAGIKYGFMATSWDKKVQDTREIVELCAKYNLICDFHDGPIPGSGDSRTYPNYLTREFCHAQSDAKRAFGPNHFVTTVYNNMLTGSLDMANGLFAIKDAEKVRPRIFEKVDTTVVAETARTLINYAALSILPDIPEAYEAKADLFKFIETMPMNWDESHVLSGEIGQHIVMARRAGETWWIGSAINEQGGDLEIDFAFLPEGSEWVASVYADAADAHYQTNPEAYTVKELVVKAGDKMTATLAPGGGHCVMLRKK